MFIFNLFYFFFVFRSYELLALDFYGNLRSFFISSTEGFQPYHTFSFGESILTAAQYVPVFDILVLASPISSIKQKVRIHR